MATTNPYFLHLLASLKSEAEKVAAAEGTTLDQFINVAVAEKLAALRTSRYFQDRAAGADLEAFDRLLATAGDEPPRLGMRCCRQKVNIPIKTGCFLSP